MRLLLAILLVVAAALGTVTVSVSLIGPGYFATAMGHVPGDPMGSMMGQATQIAFSEAMRNALVAATLIAVAAAAVVSLAVSDRIAGPVGRIAVAARRIANGHYSERVPETGEGEIRDLATTFNAMAGSLEETERRRLQLVGDVAHELRTPLATLDGYLEGLQDGVVKPTDRTWLLLRGETARLTHLVDELADLWRAEAHQLPLRTEPVDVGAICQETRDRFAPAAAARGITISVAAPPVPMVALADRDRLSEIIANYLSNAIRYSPDGASISLGMRREPGAIVASVADNGPGLTEVQLASVFERFYRVDPSRSRTLGGSGIGLAIVRALADAMGGRAWATSPGPGKGSTFFVALPDAS
jgi:signal transduction histidine kinase